MRIAVIHSFYTATQPSGENTVVLQQTEALTNAGHDVQLIARHTDDYSSSHGYATRSALTVATGRGPSPTPDLERFDPEVIHLHNTFPNYGTEWLEQWGHKTVATLHNYRMVCAAGTLFRDGHPCRDCLTKPVYPAVLHGCYRGSRPASIPLAWATRPEGALRRVAQQVHTAIVLNQDAKEILEPHCGRALEVLPNFTPTPTVAPAAPTRGWVFVGRLSREKGPLELIRAWPAHEPLSIFGDGPLREAVGEVIAERKLTDVKLFGLIDHKELLDRLSQFEGLILPSMCAEQLPTAVLEAIARGVPIVATELVSAAAPLRDAGVARLVVAPPTTASLETALDELRSDPAIRGRARELHAARYSQDAWLHSVSRIYERVASASRPIGY